MPERIPQHVAIIPDGNRRWAAENGATFKEGYQQGCNTLIETVRSAKELGLRYITAYTFSTENWRRSSGEVEALMQLLVQFLQEQEETMVREGVRLRTIGDLSPLSDAVKQAIKRAQSVTAECQTIDLILAINYGGRDEILRATKKLVALGEEITVESLEKQLDTAELPDPELIIRTSGEKRLSNFMLWQASYAEFYPTETLWPDFSKQELKRALDCFAKRERRLGA